MTIDEFFIWIETEPDAHELVDGQPVRMPDEKQGGRRMGNLIRAAELSLGRSKALVWWSTPHPALNDRMPALYVCESWNHLSAALQLLRDPEDGGMLMGDRFQDIVDRAVRFTAIERDRAARAP